MTVLGVGGHPVTVEAFVGRGLPALTFTGLPGAAVADARDRIRPAVEHAGLEWPLRRVVVNLAPGNLRKEGAGLDLPIATSVLAATGQVPAPALAGAVFFGELSLKGAVLPTPGVLSVAIAAAQTGSVDRRGPGGQRRGGRAGRRGSRRGGVVARAGRVVPPRLVARARRSRSDRAPHGRRLPSTWPTFADRIKLGGRSRSPRRAGTTCCWSVPRAPARRCWRAGCASILPELTRDEALEATQLHSVAGLLAGRGLLRQRPFRSPHHSISTAGLLGGGSTVLRPGEVESRASRGAVPRRAHRVPARRDRGAAPAAGGRTGRGHARARLGRRSRPGSRSWPRRTRARAASVTTCCATARAATISGPDTGGSCPGRCSIGSTCGCGCRG